MIHHLRAQIGVGQGSFHGAIIRSENFSFRWIYDFGTSTGIQKKILIDAWKRWDHLCQKPGNIDLFFISHFDLDHMNGLKFVSLIKNIKINKFVMPLYNDVEKLVLICNIIKDGKVTKELCDFISDPDTWLKGNFGEQVECVFVESENEGAPIENERLDENQEERSFSGMNWDKLKRHILSVGGSIFIKGTENHNNFKIKLSPFFYSDLEISRLEFKNSVLTNFKVGSVDLVLRDLINVKKYSSTKKKLKSLHVKYLSDINISSLCLLVSYEYNGRICKANIRGDEIISHRHRKNGSCLDWIGTGDSDLYTGKTRNYFFKKISMREECLQTFLLPHHGSKDDFDVLNLERLREVKNFIASYGMKNSYGHPSKIIKSCISATGAQFVDVTENSGDFVEVINFW